MACAGITGNVINVNITTGRYTLEVNVYILLKYIDLC